MKVFDPVSTTWLTRSLDLDRVISSNVAENQNLETGNSRWLDEVDAHPFLANHVRVPEMCRRALLVIVAGNAR